LHQHRFLRLSGRRYQCGEPNIDREHCELFELGDALIAPAPAKDANLDSIKSALDTLLGHVA
jgi:hypothetical protein